MYHLFKRGVTLIFQIEICKGQIAEYFVENICDKIKGEISNYETTDLIYEHNTLSFNKALETHPFKMFFTNEDNLRFVFWDIQKDNIIFTFNVNNKFYDFNLSEQNYISTTINLNDIKTIGYSYNGEYVDLLPYFNNTSKVLQLIENI